MKVIGINGSARKDGNTSLLIKAVFAELEAEGIETDLVQLHGKALEPCKACFGCGGKRQCVVKTDYFNECFAKMVEADGLVRGSPVYSADVTAGMKAFLERAGVAAATNPGMLRHKVGASVAAVRRGGDARLGFGGCGGGYCRTGRGSAARAARAVSARRFGRGGAYALPIKVPEHGGGATHG